MRSRRKHPGGGFASQGGGLVYNGGGLVSPNLTPASGYSIDTLTPSDLATIMGVPAPTHMWLGKDASGATDLAGTDHLIDVGAPVKQHNNTTLGGTNATNHFSSTSDGLDAQANTVCDVASQTVTIVWVGVFNAFGGTYDLCGKRDPVAPNHGYQLYTTSAGHLWWAVDSSSGAGAQTVAVNHGTTNAQVILCTREWTANNLAIYSREGSGTGTRLQESMTNTAVFSIGIGRFVATDVDFGMCAVWLGTDGDGMGSAERLALAQALGYE